jgi:hypothetical protein
LSRYHAVNIENKHLNPDGREPAGQQSAGKMRVLRKDGMSKSVLNAIAAYMNATRTA